MTFKHEPVENLRYFWTHPLEGNRPDDYACVGPARSEFLVRLVRNLQPQPRSIMEVGCNCGRNLHYLMEAGYKWLAGVDILDCSEAVKEYFPELKARFLWAPAEHVLPLEARGSYDLVFSMAALSHIPPIQAHIVTASMANICNGYVLIIEDEHRGWPLHHGDWSRRFFPRGYQGLFEQFGMSQLAEYQQLTLDNDIDQYFTARIFGWRQPDDVHH